MIWLKYGWRETDVLEWLQQRYTPQEIKRCCSPEEQRMTVETAETEGQAIIHSKLLRNRRLLRALRQGDYSILDGHLPDG